MRYIVSDENQKAIENNKSIRDDFTKLIATFHDDYFDIDRNFNAKLEYNWRSNIIDAIHIVPLVCFGVDMIFNKLIYPRSHLAMLVLTILFS